MNLSKISENLYANPDSAVSAATGLSEIAMNLFGKSNVYKDKVGNQMNTDMYGRPIYSTQNYQQSINGLREDARGEVGESALSGAVGGLKAVAAIGGLPGAAIGLGVGAIAGLFGGKKRKRELDNEISNRETKLKDSTKSFNMDNTNYFEDVNADSVNSYLLSQRAMRF